MRFSILFEFVIITLSIAAVTPLVSKHCQLESDFNLKFINELKGQSLRTLFNDQVKVLGKGSFGEVREVSWQDPVKGEIKVAVKKITIKESVAKDNLANEINNLFMFQGNPHIMQIIG
jgi:hypothetical protein